MTDAKVEIPDPSSGTPQEAPIVAIWARSSATGYYIPVDIEVFNRINASMSSLASEATLQELLLEVQGSGKNYHSVQEVISADKDYVIPFTGQSMIFYADKALVMKLNLATNNAINLRANIGLKVDNFELTKIILTGVQPNTTIDMIVTGN